MPVAGSTEAVPAGQILREPGVYRLHDATGLDRGLVAVSLVSAGESDLQAPSTESGPGILVEVVEARPVVSWRLLATITLVLLTLEGLLPALGIGSRALAWR